MIFVGLTALSVEISTKRDTWNRSAACAVLYHLSLFQPGEEAALWARLSREVEHDEDNLSQLIWALDRWIAADFI